MLLLLLFVVVVVDVFSPQADNGPLLNGLSVQLVGWGKTVVLCVTGVRILNIPQQRGRRKTPRLAKKKKKSFQKSLQRDEVTSIRLGGATLL